MPGAFRPREHRPQGHLKALKQQPLGLFLQDPTGCLHPAPAAPEPRSHHPRVAVLGKFLAVAGAELASVSAI